MGEKVVKEWEISKKQKKRLTILLFWVLFPVVLFSVSYITNTLYNIGVEIIIGAFLIINLFLTILMSGETKIWGDNWKQPRNIKIGDEGILITEKFEKKNFVKKTEISWSSVIRIVVSKHRKKLIIFYNKGEKVWYWTIKPQFLDTRKDRISKREIMNLVLEIGKKKNIEILVRNFYQLAPGVIYPTDVVPLRRINTLPTERQ